MPVTQTLHVVTSVARCEAPDLTRGTLLERFANATL